MDRAPVLDKAAILNADDLPRERVEVPEWGGAVFVRTLTGGERDTYEASMFEGPATDRRMKIDNIRARLVSLTVIDGEGERLFTSDEDVVELGKKSGRVLDRLFDVAQRLSGLSAKDVEELAKNSSAAPSGGGPSD